MEGYPCHFGGRRRWCTAGRWWGRWGRTSPGRDRMWHRPPHPRPEREEESSCLAEARYDPVPGTGSHLRERENILLYLYCILNCITFCYYYYFMVILHLRMFLSLCCCALPILFTKILDKINTARQIYILHLPEMQIVADYKYIWLLSIYNKNYKL